MLSAEQRVDGHMWKAVSTPASDPCSGGGLVARPGLFKLAGLKSRRCEVVGGFLGGMVTFPASRCFTLCSTAVFTGPGEGYKAEHRETRGHNQKSVPAEFVKTTTMQSTASHWEVNLLAQCLRGVCPPRVHTLGSCMLPSPLGRGVLSGTSWLLLGHAFSSLGAPGSDGFGFTCGRTCALLAAELIHFCGPITHSWLLLPVREVEKTSFPGNEIKI